MYLKSQTSDRLEKILLQESYFYMSLNVIEIKHHANITLRFHLHENQQECHYNFHHNLIHAFAFDYLL